MTPNISEVGLGKTFATLQAWWDVVKILTSAAQHAKVFSGADLGVLDMSGATFTPTAVDFPRIFVAPGEGHDGSDPTTGAHIVVNGAVNGLDIQEDFVRVEGLGIDGNTSSAIAGIKGTAVSNLIVEGILADFSAGTGGTGIFLDSSSATSSGNVIRNCIAIRANGSSFGIEVRCVTFAGSESHEVKIQNCTVYSPNSSAFDGFRFEAEAFGGTATTNVTCENCIGMGNNRADFVKNENSAGGTAVVNVTANNNLSEDTTADDFGGTGHVISQTDTDVFIDPALDSYFLKDGSAAFQSGKNLSSLFLNDAVGHPHATEPVTSVSRSFDMGALANYPFISTVKPGGGGDHLTLASWHTATGSHPSPFQWALCFKGASLGLLDLAGFSTADAINFLRTYVADGEGHDGIDPTSGAHIEDSPGFGNLLGVGVDFVRIEGLGILATGGSGASINIIGTNKNVLIDGCLVDVAGILQQCIGSTITNQFGGGGHVIRNNVCIGYTARGIDISALATGSDASNGGEIYNNVCYGAGGAEVGIRPAAFAGGGLTTTITVIIENNICMNNGTADYEEGSGSGGIEILNTTHNNNLSEDATADDFGGTGHLVSQTDTDVFVNPAGDEFTLKGGSPAIDAGKIVASVVDDIFGVGRPQRLAYDMGAFELPEPGLTIQVIAAEGLDPSFVPAVDGQNYVNTGLEYVEIRNDDGTSTTVTFQANRTVDGQAVQDLIVVVPAGEKRRVGRFKKKTFNDSLKKMNISYSKTTSLFVAAYKVGA